MTDLLEPAASTSTTPLCTQCHLHPAKYTCPRCHTRTCSAACSRAHKTAQSCSGERDKTAYVPPNKYGYGALVNDLVYLSEVGDLVKGWRRGMPKRSSASSSARGRGMGRGQARGRGRGRGGAMLRGRDAVGKGREKVEQVLGEIDAVVVWMPEGMEKRSKNSTRFDARDGQVHLTIECRFRSRQQGVRPVTVLLHDIRIRTTLESVFERLKQQKKTPLPQWAVEALDSPDSLFLLPSYPAKGHFLLEKSKTLEELLRGRTWVEWPVVEVWEKASFRGQLWAAGAGPSLTAGMSGDGGRGEGGEPAAKRRKVGDGEAIKSLLGGYASDDDDAEEEGEDGEVKEGNTKAPLVLYPDDDDAELIDIPTERDAPNLDEPDPDDDLEDEEDEEEGEGEEISPEELERMRQELAQRIADAAKLDEEEEEDEEDRAVLQRLDALVGRKLT